MSIAAAFDWETSPLIPAVVQDATTLQVLMVGFMNREALERSVETGHVTFFSRSRGTLWTKGETSGNVLNALEFRINCEENSLLVLASPVGPTCHTGHQSCYYRRIEADGSLTTILERVQDPATMYVRAGEVEKLVRRWFGAYEYLRDGNLTSVSGTANRLNDPAFDFPSRIADELLELAGVLDGSHVHHGVVEDVTLEGSQVAYWSACFAVSRQISRYDLHLISAFTVSATGQSRLEAVDQLKHVAEVWTRGAIAANDLPARISETLRVVAAACRAAGIDPLDLIRTDLADLESRDYLAPYFAGKLS